jgi:hypothetical protein
MHLVHYNTKYEGESVFSIFICLHLINALHTVDKFHIQINSRGKIFFNYIRARTISINCFLTDALNLYAPLVMVFI